MEQNLRWTSAMGNRVSGSTWFVRPIGLSVKPVDHRREAHDFVAGRRAQPTPKQVGLPTYGDKRRVSGSFLPLEQGDKRP